MKTLIINPNTSKEMTNNINGVAQNCAGTNNIIKCITNEKGPKSIEGNFDKALSLEGVLTIIGENMELYDIFIVACFSNHPSIEAAREITDKPVLGIAESAMLVSCLVSHRFTIITTSKRWEPLLESAVSYYGYQSRCASVRSTGYSVLDLENMNKKKIQGELLKEAKEAITVDDADSIIMGCAGMSSYLNFLNDNLEIPVLDGVQCAIKLGEVLYNLELKTSKIGKFTQLISKDSKNLNSVLSCFYN